MSFMTISQTADRYSAFTEGALRWIIFNKDKNGFASCIRKVGRRVLICEEDFLNWINSSASRGA